MRELSISLFKDVMKAAAVRNKKKMKKQVQRVLLPLFVHMNDQMESVAKVQRPATSVVGKGMLTPQGWPGRNGQGLLDVRVWECVSPGAALAGEPSVLLGDADGTCHWLCPAPVSLGLRPSLPTAMGPHLLCPSVCPCPCSSSAALEDLGFAGRHHKTPEVVAAPCPCPGH